MEEHSSCNIVAQTEVRLCTLLSLDSCGLLAIFGLNAFGLRSKVAPTASFLAASFSTLF
jgi:hypothetical protein